MSAEAPGPAREGLRGWVRTHPWLTGGAGVVGAAAIAFVLIWFQPQALLFDTVVDEDFPAAGTTVETPPPADTTPEPDPDDSENDAEMGDDAEAPEATEPSGPIALAAGEFASRNRYTVTGTATVYELEDGSRTLRLEDFSSTNGPDLYVYLTAADHADSDDGLAADFVDLGRLRGNVGNQNYEIPDDLDLGHYDTVVIWCERFTTSFGAADLEIG
jgi:hypothetical protein